jgi:hypothetical protein
MSIVVEKTYKIHVLESNEIWCKTFYSRNKIEEIFVVLQDELWSISKLGVKLIHLLQSQCFNLQSCEFTTRD